MRVCRGSTMNLLDPIPQLHQIDSSVAISVDCLDHIFCPFARPMKSELLAQKKDLVFLESAVAVLQ